jgi:transcriptional regulator GlxA family with amidase domain
VSEPTKHLGILLFDEVEELDAVGPWEVFAYWCKNFPDDGYAVSCLSRDGKPALAAKGLTIGAHHSFTDAPPFELLLHPGGWGTRALMHHDEHLDWVREQRVVVPLMTSVCTGSLVYAAAGLLANRPATTHWASLELLKETDPSIELRPDDRYVDDGDVISSAGVSAGIDMALHVVRRLVGEKRAKQVRRGIQYDPQPPV